jgi:hypothetical protein
MPTALAIDSRGRLRCELETGTAAQQDWFDRQDIRQIFLSQLRITAVQENPFGSQLKVTGFDAWRKDVKRLISPQDLLNNLNDCIRSAKKAIFVHGFWLGIESVRDAVLKRGCAEKYVFASNSLMNQISGISNSSLNKIILEDNRSISQKVLFLADGEKGISLDKLFLTTSAGRQEEIIVPSLLKKESVVSFRRELNS